MSRFITRIAYKGDPARPTLVLSDSTDYAPLGKTLSIHFDLTTRFCTGWHDITTGKSHTCPEGATTDKKYDVCPACQKRTGFNPAFYHSLTVSPQQEARNAEPHLLYLAYMGEGYIKVGITWHKRGINRLLDQGARAGLVLDTFPTALIARQYEDKIARLDGIHETTATRTKLALLAKPYSDQAAKTELLAAKQRSEEALGVSFKNENILYFDMHYTDSAIASRAITTLPEPTLSGTVEALVGDILLADYDGRRLALALRQYIGYPVNITNDIKPLDLEPQQMQLL